MSLLPRKREPQVFFVKFSPLPSSLNSLTCEVSGLEGEGTIVGRDAGPIGNLAVLSRVVLLVRPRARAVKAQTGIAFPIESASATKKLAPKSPVVARLIHLILGQCGWTC
jgi:hypothetical protein